MGWVFGSWVLGEPRGLGGSRAEEGRREGWEEAANKVNLVCRDPSSSPAVPGARQSCQLRVTTIMCQNDGVPVRQKARGIGQGRTRSLVLVLILVLVLVLVLVETGA